MKFFLILLLFTTMDTILTAQTTNSTVLKYLVKEPTIKTDKAPLVVLLHGVGSNEKDLFSFANQFPANFLVVSARAPYAISEGRYTWFQVDFSTGRPHINPEQAEQSRKTIIEFIGQLKGIYSIDEKQVYLVGFSQGGIMSYSVGLTHPQLIHGIGVMSSRLLDEVKPLIASKTALAKLNIFISHGTNDAVLNIDYARSAKTYLKTLALEPTYKEYTEGHTINKEMLGDLLNWLKAR